MGILELLKYRGDLSYREQQGDSASTSFTVQIHQRMHIRSNHLSPHSLYLTHLTPSLNGLTTPCSSIHFVSCSILLYYTWSVLTSGAYVSVRLSSGFIFFVHQRKTCYRNHSLYTGMQDYWEALCRHAYLEKRWKVKVSEDGPYFSCLKALRQELAKMLTLCQHILLWKESINHLCCLWSNTINKYNISFSTTSVRGWIKLHLIALYKLTQLNLG